jgi:hypothetical protein
MAVQRAGTLYGALSGQFGTALRVDLSPYIALAGDPNALIGAVDARLFFGRMSPALRQTLLTATQAVADTRQRALGALWLAAISSEFAVIR